MIAPITPPFRSVISRVNPAERLAAGDVRWVAREAGNGAGYDIRSFGTDGKTRDHPESRLRSTVLVYRRDMPASKGPTAEDTVTARRVLLDGLSRDTDMAELLSELAPLHPRNNTFPGEVFLHVAADALAWCAASRADPLPLEGLRMRFLPECDFRGRQNAKLQYAVLAAAAIHGGTEPDLLDEVAWWQTDDFWQYAMYAAVAFIRAAASQASVPIREVCQDLGERPGRLAT